MDTDGPFRFDARALHGWLNVGRRFTSWLQERVAEYGFEEGSDFLPVSGKSRGRPRKDYLLTSDMAKELSMVERTEVGRAARRYFIRMESAAMKMAADHVANGTPEAIPQVAAARSSVVAWSRQNDAPSAEAARRRPHGAPEVPAGILGRKWCLPAAGQITHTMGRETAATVGLI